MMQRHTRFRAPIVVVEKQPLDGWSIPATREPSDVDQQLTGEMPASSRFYTSATCSLATASSRSPPRHRRASLMGQSPSAPPGRSRSRSRNGSSSRWPHPGLGLDLGFLLGRKPRPGDERPDLASWMRCFLSQRLPQPTATADAEGKAAGRREEEEVGADEADHLVVMVNGLYGRCVRNRFALGCSVWCSYFS